MSKRRGIDLSLPVQPLTGYCAKCRYEERRGMGVDRCPKCGKVMMKPCAPMTPAEAVEKIRKAREG